MRVCVILIMLASSPAYAQPAAVIAATLRAICEAAGGTLTIGAGFEQAIDLTGDGMPEQVVDEAATTCTAHPPPANSPRALHVTVGTVSVVFTAQGWTTATLPGKATPALILGLPGEACGLSATAACFQALAWTGSGFAGALPTD